MSKTKPSPETRPVIVVRHGGGGRYRRAGIDLSGGAERRIPVDDLSNDQLAALEADTRLSLREEDELVEATEPAAPAPEKTD